MHVKPIAPLLLLTACGLFPMTHLGCGDDSNGSKDTSEPADTASGDTTGPDTRDTSGGDTASPPCDPVNQTGCDVAQNCTYVGSSTTASCVSSGPVPANHECSTENRCEHGVCMSINQTANLCYQVCNADTDCGAGTANECLTLTGTVFKVCKIPGIYEQCNLLTQGCSDQAKACYAVAGEPEPVCLEEGEGAPGAECASAAACKKGYACVNDVCRALCDLHTAGSCGATATCRDFFDDAGYCAPN